MLVASDRLAVAALNVFSMCYNLEVERMCN